MKTLRHLKHPLHAAMPNFSHEHSPPKAPSLEAPELPYDYVACMDHYMECYNLWVAAPSRASLQYKQSPRAIAMWLALNASRDPYRKRQPEDRADMEAQYPPSYLEALSDEQVQDLLEANLEAMLRKLRIDDSIVELFTTMFARIWELPTMCARFLPHWPPQHQANVLYQLQKLYPAESAIFKAHAIELAKTKPTLERWEEPLFTLLIAILSDDQEALLRFYEDEPYLGFKLRSVGMEAYIHIKQWEDFRRVAYEIIPNYSPAALYAHLHNFGEQGLELALEKTKQVWSSTWGGVFKIHSKAVTKHALWVLQEPQRSHQDAAKRWLYREGANAIIGALELWDDEVFGAAAQDLLKDYIWLGHKTLVLELAAPFPLATPQLQAWSAEDAQEATLTEEAVALDYWLKRGLKHPIPDGVMLPLRSAQGQRLSAGQVEGLLRLLQEHHKPRARAALCVLPYFLDYPQRVTLAAHLFSIWRSTDKANAFDWCLECLPWVLPEGLEILYLSFRDELYERISYSPWYWGLQQRLTARWDKFLAVALNHRPPSAFVIIANEFGEHPFMPQRRWTPSEPHQPHPLVSAAQALPKAQQVERFEYAIIHSAAESQHILDGLYYPGLYLLKATWSAEAWLELKDDLVSRGLRTRALWAAETEEIAIFRVDQDGSLLNAEDHEITLPEHATIRAISLDELEEHDQQRWSHTLAEHAIILASFHEEEDDDDDDEDDEEE